MAGAQSSNKALVPIIAIGAALVLGAGAYFMMAGEEPTETIQPQASEPDQVTPVNDPAPTKPVASRTRETPENTDRATRARGPEQTEPVASGDKEHKRRTNTAEKKKKDNAPAPPASMFSGKGEL